MHALFRTQRELKEENGGRDVLSDVDVLNQSRGLIAAGCKTEWLETAVEICHSIAPNFRLRSTDFPCLICGLSDSKAWTICKTVHHISDWKTNWFIFLRNSHHIQGYARLCCDLDEQSWVTEETAGGSRWRCRRRGCTAGSQGENASHGSCEFSTHRLSFLNQLIFAGLEYAYLILFFNYLLCDIICLKLKIKMTELHKTLHVKWLYFCRQYTNFWGT